MPRSPSAKRSHQDLHPKLCRIPHVIHRYTRNRLPHHTRCLALFVSRPSVSSYRLAVQYSTAMRYTSNAKLLVYVFQNTGSKEPTFKTHNFIIQICVFNRSNINIYTLWIPRDCPLNIYVRFHNLIYIYIYIYNKRTQREWNSRNLLKYNVNKYAPFNNKWDPWQTKASKYRKSMHQSTQKCGPYQPTNLRYKKASYVKHE